MQEWWTHSDAHIVVATIAFGMGIDKADVRYVYHFNLPKGLEVVLAGDRPRRTRRRAVRPARSSHAATNTDARELRVRRHADPRGDRRPARRRVRTLAGRAVRRLGIRALVTPRRTADVLKTILTYLEPEGFLEQGTLFYAGYSVRPASGEWDDVYATSS